jgi:gustatory receptor
MISLRYLKQICLKFFHRLVNITIALYGTMSEIIDHGFLFSFKEIGLLVDTVYCSTLLFVFCDCSQGATLKVAQGVQDTLLSINLLNIDHPAQREINIFIQAIEMNPAIVSLSGYAEVNRALLTSVRRERQLNEELNSNFCLQSVSVITIYLIVLVQFKLSLVSKQSGNSIS